MTLTSSNDRSALLTLLGQSVTYTPVGGEASSIYGVFAAPYQAADLFNATITTAEPTLLAQASDITGTWRESSLVIGGTTYTVKENHPDGEGFTVLVLQEA